MNLEKVTRSWHGPDLPLFQLGHPAPRSAADLLSQAVLGGGPDLGIAGLLVASMVPPEASGSHQS